MPILAPQVHGKRPEATFLLNAPGIEGVGFVIYHSIPGVGFEFHAKPNKYETTILVASPTAIHWDAHIFPFTLLSITPGGALDCCFF